MSRVNALKNARNISWGLETTSICNGNYKLSLAVLAASLLVMYALLITPTFSMAFAQTTTNNTSITNADSLSANKAGTIKSVQNDDAGTWNLSGTWNFTSLNSNSPAFSSTFNMTKEDGSAMHSHTINDFQIIGNPTKTGIETIYNGTATVSMRDGPVSNVPISITLSDNGSISIMVDPKATNNHFGSTPIQGKADALGI